MDTPVAFSADNDDELRSLRSWLARDAELLGRLRLDDRGPRPGELGGTLETLLALAAPGGVAVALITGAVTWLQSRRSSVRLRMVRSDGAEMELEARVVGSLSAAELSALIDRAARWALPAGKGPAQKDPAQKGRVE